MSELVNITYDTLQLNADGDSSAAFTIKALKDVQTKMRVNPKDEPYLVFQGVRGNLKANEVKVSKVSCRPNKRPRREYCVRFMITSSEDPSLIHVKEFQLTVKKVRGLRENIRPQQSTSSNNSKSTKQTEGLGRPGEGDDDRPISAKKSILKRPLADTRGAVSSPQRQTRRLAHSQAAAAAQPQQAASSTDSSGAATSEDVGGREVSPAATELQVIAEHDLAVEVQPDSEEPVEIRSLADAILLVDEQFAPIEDIGLAAARVQDVVSKMTTKVDITSESKLPDTRPFVSDLLNSLFVQFKNTGSID